MNLENRIRCRIYLVHLEYFTFKVCLTLQFKSTNHLTIARSVQLMRDIKSQLSSVFSLSFKLECFREI